MNYAFVYLLDTIPGVTYSHTMSEYQSKAKELLLKIPTVFPYINNGLDSSQVGTVVAYDWLYSSLTASEKTTLVKFMKGMDNDAFFTRGTTDNVWNSFVPMARSMAIQAGLLSRGMRPYATLAFLGLRWKFKGPLKIGDTIQVRARVVSKRETSKPDRGIVTLERQVVNQRGEVVQEGETDLMVARRVP